MCGLLGLVCPTEGHAVARRDAVRAAMRCQRHRGPDETDTWAQGEVVYGFNRLGFIDLEHSHQPLIWGPPENPTRYTLNFNGEIYNYRELRKELADRFGVRYRTKGDGEAIVAAYHHLGPNSVRKLRGMFAFLIWDNQDKVVFGARDPFGIKPLYWSGGLDSSLIVALLAEAGARDLLTFSIGFESLGSTEGDEFEYSDLIARRFGTDHHRLRVP
ncbi:asparagine synthetase B family protein, partial [Actinophytocola sp.]|uniref:asparagine synthetase B family protein n=1 Tax=Actinophytocola sp. TaxID=1872138 RepID=UPI00389AE087